MGLLIGLKTIFGFLPKGTAKSSNASGAEENTLHEGLETAASAQNASEKKRSLEGRMTIEKAKRKLCDWAKSQVGYHEGYDGSNKYGADGDWDQKLYGFEASTVAWCDVFVDYGFIWCFGFAKGTAMTYQQPTGFAACSLSANAYKDNGAFYQKPEVGDQVFFIYSGGINHTGIVISVDGSTIQCVEGNYSNSVCLTRYRLGNPIIAGFGRPDWGIVADEQPLQNLHEFDDVDDTQFDIEHPERRRSYMHLQYGDGIGNPLPQVKAWQNLLLCWGYKLGIAGADGEFGISTETATRQWQEEIQNNGADVEVNGIVDEDDWKEIVSVECEGGSIWQ